MGICTGEGLTSDTSDERIDAKTAGLEGRGIREEKTGEDRRQKGGSPIGGKRADEIVGWFEYANGCLDMYGKSLLFRTGVYVNRFVRSAFELPGIAALKRIVNPSNIYLFDPPKFRERAGEEDTLCDIRALVKASCAKLAALDMAQAGEDRKAVVDEEWARKARTFDENFDGVAKLTRLNKRHAVNCLGGKAAPGKME
jgi:hypothetical protein